MLMQIPKQNPEYALVETAPPLAARLSIKEGIRYQQLMI
jgi:hypothetical protein